MDVSIWLKWFKNRKIDYGSKENKEKKLTNMRASGSDEGIKLTPKKEMTLEMMMEFVEDDELIEVTPKSLRIRKRILDSKLRKKSHKN